jgi:hypothetical protein
MKKIIFLLILLSITLFVFCNPPTVDSPEISSATPGDGEVTIKWTAVTGATSYNIYYKEGTTVTIEDGTKVEDAESPHTITGLTNGTTYAFGLTAIVDGNETELSEVVTATPLAMWEFTSDNADFNGGNKNDLASKMAVDDSENIYVAGTSYDPNAQEQIVWVMMLDSSGALGWDVNITDTDSLSVEALVVDGDALYVGMNISSTSSITGRIEKLNTSDGQFYGGDWPSGGIVINNTANSDFINDLIVKDGSIFVVGAEGYAGNTGTPPWIGDWMIANYSATDGTLDASWSTNPVLIDGTSSGNGDDDDVAYDVVADDTNLYVVGRYGYVNPPYYSQGFASITIADGTVNWGGTDDKYEFNHDPDYREIPDGMVIDSSSNLYTVASMDKYDIDNDSTQRVYQQGWLMSVDSSGSQTWEITFQPENEDYFQMESIATDETNIYVVGHETDADIFAPDTATIRKFDMSGNEDTSWETEYVYDDSQSDIHNSFSDIVVVGTALYVVGTTFNDTSGYDFWIKKLAK